jgi:hypothetical protein
MESPPAAAFVVIEPEFVFHLLIVSLDAPAALHQTHQIFDVSTPGDR